MYQQDKFVLPSGTTSKGELLNSVWPSPLLATTSLLISFFRCLVKNQLFKYNRFNKSISRKRKRTECDI